MLKVCLLGEVEWQNLIFFYPSAHFYVKFPMFPTFPTSLLYREKLEETVRKNFLCFLPFLRALSYREKLKKRKERISYISY